MSVYKKVIEVSGTKLEYSGSDHIIERINCSKMLHEDIELLVSAVKAVLNGHCIVRALSF